MIPASFVPMIAKMVLGKKILPKLQEEIAKHMAKMFKLDQILNYMELPNDADRNSAKALGLLSSFCFNSAKKFLRFMSLNFFFSKYCKVFFARDILF